MCIFNRFWRFLFLGIICIIGCSREDATPAGDEFYGGADKTASPKNLAGIWAIYTVGFEGKKSEVPITFESCGRDFFVYSEDGKYSEYLYQSSSCEPLVNHFEWNLENGILQLRNSLGQADDLVIIKLTGEELVFKSRFDVDGDGKFDVVDLFARKYQPKEPDLISESFYANTDEAFKNLLSVKWNAYDGIYEFDRYEIYRSIGQECSKLSAELIATIKDASIGEFTDTDPPQEKTLCYFIKVFTLKGLLAETRLIDLNTEYIIPSPVELERPLVFNDQIELNWKAYQSPYFSHFEVVFCNFSFDIVASSYQENTLAIIDDKNATNFIVNNPPNLENPFYAVYAYNIFGNKSSVYNNEKISSWEVIYKKPNLLDFRSINSYAIDSEEPIVYLYGSISRMEPEIIQRYNYQTQETEAVSNLSPPYYTSAPIELFNSSNGKEIVINQGSELSFYNAITLEYKYNIDPEGPSNIHDIVYMGDDLWAITDSDSIFTFKRDNANLFLVDSSPHYTEHQSMFNYSIYELGSNRLMVGHENEPNSIVYTMDGNGKFLNHKNVSIQARSYNGNKILYNPAENYLLDLSQNRLYSGETFQYIESFETPYFPSGVSKDGLKIYGTNNNPDWEIIPESLHKKEAIIFDRNTRSFEKIETLGYPHVLFENNNGEVFSISSGLKKERLSQNINDKADIFIEKVGTH